MLLLEVLKVLGSEFQDLIDFLAFSNYCLLLKTLLVELRDVFDIVDKDLDGCIRATVLLIVNVELFVLA